MAESKRDAIEKQRAERKAALAEAKDEQDAADLEALNDAEIKHGDSNVCHLAVPYTPGMPAMVIARCPTPLEAKRFQDRVKPKANGKTDPNAGIDAAKELTACVLVYPSKDVFAELCEQRSMLTLELGVKALKLAGSAAQEEGND